MKLFRRQFLQLVTGCCRVANGATHRESASLSDADGYNNCAVCPRRSHRRFRPRGRRAYVPHARAAVDYRECPGGWRYDGLNSGMRATPDGYAVEMGHIGTHAVSVWLYPDLAYKPDVDFEPIGLVMESPVLIAARKDFPAGNLEEFVAYVKANSEKLNMAHAGVGSILYSFGLMLNFILGVKPTLVPFNGGNPATNALLAGHVDYMCGSTVDVGAQVEAGMLKAYAIAADKRSPALPNVPTTTEAGLPEFKAMPWFALFAPKGTPRPILDKLSDALDKALDDPNVRRRLSDLGGYIPDKARQGRQALATLVKDEIARWAPIIKTANVNP